MSAPIPEEHPPQFAHSAHQHGMQATTQPHCRGSLSVRKMSGDVNGGLPGIEERAGSGRHSRKASRDDQIPPPPPPPPVLKELQHLATPPPPPPAPIPGVRPTIYTGAQPSGSGTIEIVMDEDDDNNNNVASIVPVPEPAPQTSSPQMSPSSRNGHSRGRSFGDNSIAGRISRAAERMRSGSRGRTGSILGNRTKSPDTATIPYESVPPPVSMHNGGFTSPVNQQLPQSIERHPREVRAAYQEREFGSGLHASEMI